MTQEAPGSAARRATAERMRPYFALQLALARRMAALTDIPLSAATLRYTNFHRRFGLGRWRDGEPAAAWRPYAAALDACADPAQQVALTAETLVGMPGASGHDAGRKTFGCFACDAPAADGAVQIHFLNLDTDEAGGPLSTAKLPRRRAEMAAMIGWLRAEHPAATHIKGRSWLYHTEAYRRVFPPEYGASAQPAAPPFTLHGNSLWGQTIDSWERVKPQAAEAVLSALPAMDPAAPWTVFPQRVLTTRAPIEAFEAFYGL